MYARVKDTKSVTKEFLDTLKICSGVVVVENDNIVPLTEIKRLQDLHVQVACKCTPEYLGKSIVSCIRSDRPDGLYTTVVVNRLGVALGLVYVCTLFFFYVLHITSHILCSRRYSSKESIVEAVKIGQGVYVHEHEISLEYIHLYFVTQILLEVTKRTLA